MPTEEPQTTTDTETYDTARAVERSAAFVQPPPGEDPRSPREQVQQALVQPYRTPAGAPVGEQKAAPPWVADVAHAIASSIPRNMLQDEAVMVGRMVLRWCADGEPVSRATTVLALLRIWPRREGRHLEELIHFVRDSRKAGSGRPKGCLPKPFVVPVTWSTWAAFDASKKAPDPVTDIAVRAMLDAESDTDENDDRLCCFTREDEPHKVHGCALAAALAERGLKTLADIADARKRMEILRSRRHGRP